MTTDSPWTLGSVTTRRSTWRPSMLSPTRPSCGTRRSAMSRSRHDLHAADDAGDHAPRHGRGVLEHAVDAEAHAQLAAVGREVDVGRALLDGLGDDPVDELDDRRVVGRLAQVDDLGCACLLLLDEGGLHDVVEARQARDERGDVLARGDRRADLVAAHHRDVVDREHVRRVGHRDDAASARRRTRPAPPRSAWPRRSRGGSPPPCRPGRRSGRGGRARCARRSPGRAGRRDRAPAEQDLLGRVRRLARRLDGGLDPLAVGEAELDDDVGEEARAGVALQRGG